MFDQLNETDQTAAIERAADLIQSADALIVAAGAGMGVDSGLPDYRGETGFWKAYPALETGKTSYTSIASPAAFRASPDRAWGFFGHRLEMYRKTIPHAGFALLKRWGEQMEYGYSIYTSNVDGQFQKAGFREDRIYECHGSIHSLQCLKPCSDLIWDADCFEPDVDEKQCRLRNPLPQCHICGGMARPNIYMFSDLDWIDKRAALQRIRLEAWLSNVTCPVVIEIGAGTEIWSVREFSHRMIIEAGGRLIRINPFESRVPTSLDVGLAMRALDGLSAIEQVLVDREGTCVTEPLFF